MTLPVRPLVRQLDFLKDEQFLTQGVSRAAAAAAAAFPCFPLPCRPFRAVALRPRKGPVGRGGRDLFDLEFDVAVAVREAGLGGALDDLEADGGRMRHQDRAGGEEYAVFHLGWRLVRFALGSHWLRGFSFSWFLLLFFISVRICLHVHCVFGTAGIEGILIEENQFADVFDIFRHCRGSQHDRFGAGGGNTGRVGDPYLWRS